MDRWQSLPIVCKGGLDVSLDVLTLGTQKPGAATILTNYEPSIQGGYARIQGYSKWDTAIVPGDSNAPVLGVCAHMGGVFACRHSTSLVDNAIYFSSGSGWTKINTSTRPGALSKVRILNYALAKPSIYITDSVNPAAKWDGTTYTTINGTGAPNAPKYSAAMPSYIALAQGNQLYVSAPNSDTDFNGADGAVQFNIGDTITGLKRFRDILYIFCASSIFSLSGTSSADYALDAVTNQLGCISHDSILEVGGDLIFLAQDGFRSLAATYRIDDLQLGNLSHPINPILVASDFTQGHTSDSFCAVYIAQKAQYRCWVYDASTPKSSAFGVLGRRLDNLLVAQYEWGTLQGIQPYCSHSNQVGTQDVAVIGDPLNGFVYRLESGNDFDGTAVPYIYRTPDLTFNDVTLRKVMQKVTIFTQAAGNVQVTLNVLLDTQQTGVFQPPPQTLTQIGSLPLYDTAIYGSANYAVVANPEFRLPVVGAGFLVAFQFSGTDNNAPHRIDSFQIEYAEKGRR